ncbi:MAG: PEP-CTERM sorting domain-containing protein, partial [Akkermansia sp.]|nr:PEP-CTERM sorting domain-containing protein [Akkermansia sp.]
NLTAGSGIIFTADSWLGQLLTAQGATAYVSGAVETPASVSEGGSTGGVSVSYSAATGGNVGTVITITGLNVPEPATSTLSLLALAALAARRRRND